MNSHGKMLFLPCSLPSPLPLGGGRGNGRISPSPQIHKSSWAGMEQKHRRLQWLAVRRCTTHPPAQLALLLLLPGRLRIQRSRENWQAAAKQTKRNYNKKKAKEINFPPIILLQHCFHSLDNVAIPFLRRAEIEEEEEGAERNRQRTQCVTGSTATSTGCDCKRAPQTEQWSRTR